MNCFEVRNKILDCENADYESLFGLPEDVCKHIEACKDCRSFLDELSKIKALLKAAQPLPVNDGVALHEHIAKRIAAGDTATPLAKKRRFFPVATLAAVAAVIAVVCIGGLPLGELADKFVGSASKSDSAIEISDTEAQNIGGIFDMADYFNETVESSAEDVGHTDDSAVIMMKNYESYNNEMDSVTYGLKNSGTSDGANTAAGARYVVADESGSADADGDSDSGTNAAPEQPAAQMSRLTGETTAAYDPTTEPAANSEAFPGDIPILMSVDADKLQAEEVEKAEAEAEAKAEEEAVVEAEAEAVEKEFTDATTATTESASDQAPETAEEIITFATEIFNPDNCPHNDNRHAITLEMAKGVGEDEFVRWYIEVASADMENLYTVEAFENYFGKN